MIFIATEVSLFSPFIIVPEGDDEDCSPAFSSRFPRARYGKHIRYVLEHDAGLEPKDIVNKYYGQKNENAIAFCYQNSIVLVT